MEVFGDKHKKFFSPERIDTGRVGSLEKKMEKRTPDFKRRIGHPDRALRAGNRNAPGPTGLIHERFINSRAVTMIRSAT